jgi:hypothetical protein
LYPFAAETWDDLELKVSVAWCWNSMVSWYYMKPVFFILTFWLIKKRKNVAQRNAHILQMFYTNLCQACGVGTQKLRLLDF